MSLGQHCVFVERRLAFDERDHRVSYQLVTETDVLQSHCDPLTSRRAVDEMLEIRAHMGKGCSGGVVVYAGAPRTDQ